MASLMQISRNSRQLFRILPFNLPFTLLDVSPPEKSCDLFRVKAFYLRIFCGTRAEQRSACGTRAPPSVRFLPQPGDKKNTADSAMDEKPPPLPKPPVIASFTSVFIPRALPPKAQSLRTAFSLWRNGKNYGADSKKFSVALQINKGKVRLCKRHSFPEPQVSLTHRKPHIRSRRGKAAYSA